MQEGIQIFPGNDLAADYGKLYRAVCEQIRKDFHPHVIMNDLPDHLDPVWIHDELRRLLSEVITTQNAALGPILYRVDLPEKQVRSAMQVTLVGDKLEELTAMVLRREAQKVWLRHTLK